MNRLGVLAATLVAVLAVPRPPLAAQQREEPLYVLIEHVVAMNDGEWTFDPTIAPRRHVAEMGVEEPIPESLRRMATEQLQVRWQARQESFACDEPPIPPNRCRMLVSNYGRISHLEQSARIRKYVVETAWYEAVMLVGRLFELTLELEDGAWRVTGERLLGIT